jgi:hypothetical protein
LTTLTTLALVLGVAGLAAGAIWAVAPHMLEQRVVRAAKFLTEVMLKPGEPSPTAPAPSEPCSASDVGTTRHSPLGDYTEVCSYP